MLKNLLLKTITVLCAVACFLCLCGIVESDHSGYCAIGALATFTWCFLFAAVNGGLYL